jgi:hypothetical protein
LSIETNETITEVSNNDVDTKPNSFLSSLASIISVLFHPLAVSSLFFAMILYTQTSILYPVNETTRETFLALYNFAYVCNSWVKCCFDFQNIFYCRFKLSEKSSRNIPLLFTAIFYLVLGYAFYSKFRVNDIFFLAFFSVGFSVLIAFFVNIFWKISLHSIAIGGVIGWIISIQYAYLDVHLLYQFIGTTIIGGLVVWARLYLQQHTIWQTIAGLVVGFGICFVSLLIKI